MSVSDALQGDDEWVKGHVKMAQRGLPEDEGWSPEGSKVEIALEWGADVSVMPARWLRMQPNSEVTSGNVMMRNAQGPVRPNLGTRLVTIDLGRACIQQEQFHASSVCSPLLSLERLLCNGRSLSHRNNMLCLRFIPVSFRKNSLMVEVTVHHFSVNSDMSPIPEPEAADMPEAPDEEGRRTFVTFDLGGTARAMTIVHRSRRIRRS